MVSEHKKLNMRIHERRTQDVTETKQYILFPSPSTLSSLFCSVLSPYGPSRLTNGLLGAGPTNWVWPIGAAQNGGSGQGEERSLRSKRSL